MEKKEAIAIASKPFKTNSFGVTLGKKAFMNVEGNEKQIKRKGFSKEGERGPSEGDLKRRNAGFDHGYGGEEEGEKMHLLCDGGGGAVGQEPHPNTFQKAGSRAGGKRWRIPYKAEKSEECHIWRA